MGMFNDVNDAMGQVGGLLNSPAMTSVDKMKNASTSLNVTANLDPFVLEQGFPGHGNAFYQQMQEIQNLSDAFDECGNYAQDLVQASTEDYIKSTGIQEAGRDLANTLGQYKDEIDCAAGFATLFDSKGIIDDVLGIGDLPQIQSRVQQIVLDATNPSKLANMITNLDAVQGLLEPFNDFCTGMKDALNLLVAKDLAAFNAILNKLAQWAAFTNLATGDPCALVNNKKMFSSVTDPVMDDILDLYDGILDGDLVETISDIFSPDTPTALVGGDKPLYKQANGLVPYDSYFAKLSRQTASPTAFEGYFGTLGTYIGDAVTSISDVISYSGDATSSSPLSWNGEEWTDGSIQTVSSDFDAITLGVLQNNNSFNAALENFKKMKETVEFELFRSWKDSTSSYTVTSCSKGIHTTKSECLKNGGSWAVTNYTAKEYEDKYGLDGSVISPNLDNITNAISSLFDSKTDITQLDLNSVDNGIDNDMALEVTTQGGNINIMLDDGGSGSSPKGSGADVASNAVRSPAVKNHISGTSSSINTTPVPQEKPSRKVSTIAYNQPSNTSTPFSLPSTINKSTSGATIQQPGGSTESFESSITSFDGGLNEIRKALDNGDFSNITICKCIGKLNITNEVSCNAGGGLWKCQEGTSDSKSNRNIESTNMITSARNRELSSMLPSSAAFTGIV